MAAVIAGARVVTPVGVIHPGWVVVDGSRITSVGDGPPPADLGALIDLGDAWLLPGFVDLHSHGGGGFTFAGGSAAAAEAAAFHLDHGTTTTLASLATAPVDDMVNQVAELAELIGPADGDGPARQPVAGIHLEGPFLAHARCGAHDPDLLLEPDPKALRRMVEAGAGTVRMVTIAPELTDALAAIGAMTSAGIIVAVGHTDATYAQAGAAFDSGASVLTHAGNAMRPFHHREPGPLLAAVDAKATIEVINDGVHLHDATVRSICRQAPGRTAFVTDAIAAAGLPDGPGLLGEVAVDVRDGVARVAGTDTLAGSTITMDRAVRRAVQEVGLRIDLVAHAAATAPAELLGLSGLTGRIVAGLAADLVALDDDLAPFAVMRRGTWITPPH